MAGPAGANGPSQTVTFTPTAAVLPNPERGFYRAARGDLDRLDPAFLDAAYGDGYRLIYARINLEPYRAAELPADYLDRLNAGFAAARRAGVKLIVRAVYNYPRGETEYRDAKDAPLPLVLRHLQQLRPLLHDNADVIAFVQAGFIGAWGEWHTSSNALTEPAPRTAIKDALLAAVPAERFVQFRYPPFIQEWTPRLAGGFRIGFHNDCFLASQTDVGTYSEEPRARATAQDHMDRLGDLAPFGGETCNPADDPGAAPRTSCPDIMGEGARYNLTYLNADYYRRIFHDAWADGGCSEEVARRMGYRLRLLDASYDGRATAGDRLRLSVTVRNDGWARPYNPRPVEVLLRARSTGTVLRLPTAADPQLWLPGANTSVALDVALPQGLAPDAYELLIALPDASPSLRADSRYAIRLANGDDRAKGQEWNATLGAFGLGAAVTIVSENTAISSW